MRKNFDIPSIRARLAGKHGRKYWRSLEEVAETEEFQDLLKQEFPQGVDQWLNPVSRRGFLKLMAASFALGGLAACSPNPPEKIVPYVEAPEEIVPGKPLFFATAMKLGGVATGLLAESHMGRPTKIEGNPDHPGSLGRTDVFGQASILNLYDPDRASSVTNAGLVSSWQSFRSTLTTAMGTQSITQGAGLRILTETITSPTVGSMIESLLEQYPEAKWHQYEPVNRDNIREGAILAFGEDVNPVYDFTKAEVIVSLESDFMAAGPIGVRYAHDFSEGRRIRYSEEDEHKEEIEMNRLYVVESTPTVTGSMADHRLPLQSKQVESFARALAGAVGAEVPEGDTHGIPEKWVNEVARDLMEKESSIVIAGPQQPPIVHALAHAINEALGNVGNTVTYSEPLEANPVNQMDSLKELVQDMENGDVSLLIIVEANPVYNAPADLNFAEKMQGVDTRIRMGLYLDETSALCQWHIPMKHYLESWDDSKAYDGTVSLTQPLVEPFHKSFSVHDLLAALLADSGKTDYDYIREYWTNEGIAEGDFEQFWTQSLYNGFFADTASTDKSVAVELSSLQPAEAASASEGLEITFRPDPAVWDGRFANNGWLQELPKPINKLTWDNAAYVSAADAEEMGVTMGDMIELISDEQIIFAPVWIQPGQAKGSITVNLGYGRTRAGRVGDELGFNAYQLQSSDTPWMISGVTVNKTGENYLLVSTQSHYNMEDRSLVRVGTLEHFLEEPEFAHHMGAHVDTSLTMLPEWDYDSYAWGMVVDLNACNGCNACVVACQAENNIPVVGKDQVEVGREMSWLRIDSYFDDLDNPEMHHQPVMCQHCEQAPCELVCPVNATMHDAEGLNLMVYNRCIGTRYCSNNCPYKVRRFNYLSYNDVDSESLKGHRNPNVTVRVRGVMEKCTYCLQRISTARINAKKEDRRIADGEVVAACQAACPTRAIIFGDINDPDSEVSKLKKQHHNYEILDELGTRPRTSYLARLRNPNSHLVEEQDQSGSDEAHG